MEGLEYNKKWREEGDDRVVSSSYVEYVSNIQCLFELGIVFPQRNVLFSVCVTFLCFLKTFRKRLLSDSMLVADKQKVLLTVSFNVEH